MSAPKSSASFSLKDLSSLFEVKKEKSESLTTSQPPATRTKTIASKKWKSTDAVVYLDTFDGLAPSEVSNKLLSMQAMMNLGIEKLSTQTMETEQKLAEAEDKIKSQAETAVGKTHYYEQKLMEQRLAFEAEKTADAETSKLSAARSVLESKIQMAREADVVGLKVDSCNVEAWTVALESLGGGEEKATAAGKEEDDGCTSKVTQKAEVVKEDVMVKAGGDEYLLEKVCAHFFSLEVC